jgi:hypothetical protein
MWATARGYTKRGAQQCARADDLEVDALGRHVQLDILNLHGGCGPNALVNTRRRLSADSQAAA